MGAPECMNESQRANTPKGGAAAAAREPQTPPPPPPNRGQGDGRIAFFGIFCRRASVCRARTSRGRERAREGGPVPQTARLARTGPGGCREATAPQVSAGAWSSRGGARIRVTHPSHASEARIRGAHPSRASESCTRSRTSRARPDFSCTAGLLLGLLVAGRASEAVGTFRHEQKGGPRIPAPDDQGLGNLQVPS